MSQIKEEDMSALDQGNFFDNDDIFSEIDIIASTEKLIVSEELFYRQIEDWISFTRRNFDCHINGEPHQAVNFLLNPRTGEYLIRVWSRTVTTGYLLNLDSVSEKIQETFQGQLPCTGFLSSEQEQIGNVIFTDFPFSRMMSSNCAFLTQKNTTTQEDEQLLCNFCVYMNDNIDKPNALNGDGLLPPPNFPEPKPNIGTTSLKEEPSSDEKMSESEEECADNSFDLVDPSDPEETKVEEAEVPNDHQCTRCPEILKSKKDLVNHEYYEHMRGTYPCKIPQCQFQGSFAEDYVQHLNGEHAGEMTTLNCRICKEYIPTHDFCQHLKSCIVVRGAEFREKQKKLKEMREMKKTKRKKRTSKGEQSPLEKKIPKPLKCRLCPEMLKSVGSKLKHEKEVHNIRNFECGPCNLSFKNIKGIQSHNLFKHGRVRVKCKLCVKYSVTTTHQFMDHHRDEHPDHPEVDCFQCRQKIPNDSFSSHVIECVNKVRQDKKKGYLAVRRQKIKEQGGLKCNYCDLKFKCDITLKTHESKVHVGPKYTCDICGYGSAFKHTIIKHQEIHQEVVPKVCCQECGEMVRPGSLNSHYKRRHGGLDNVTCEICGEHFERIEHLKTHTNLKHMDSCKFDCPICGKRMGNISSKISHMRVHEEGKYVCKICGKALKKKKSLLIHERTHTGEKPFKCSQCDMAYISKLSLHNHIKFVHKKVPYAKKKPPQPKPGPLIVNDVLTANNPLPQY